MLLRSSSAAVTFHFRSLPFPPCSLGSRPPRSGAECSYPKELSSDKSQPMRFQRTLALVLLLSLSLHLVASPDDSSHSLCTVLGDLDPSPDLAIDRTRQYLSLALPRHTSLFRLSSKSPFHCHESSFAPICGHVPYLQALARLEAHAPRHCQY